jgi:hypothetical protein
VFVDEYLLPRLEENAANGWPDWAVLWADRVWIIELKTEAGSHRADQLPYYLRLAAAAHPCRSLDLTYVTGPLSKPARALLEGQRYSHVTWDDVVPLIHETWGHDARPQVAAYVDMVNTLVSNLSRHKPSAQREIVLGGLVEGPGPAAAKDPADPGAIEEPSAPESHPVTAPNAGGSLLELARATATDGRQRAIGAPNPEELEALRDRALTEIGSLASSDNTRLVLPWLWDGTRTGGRALTPEGEEFGYELRFSRYKRVRVNI